MNSSTGRSGDEELSLEQVARRIIKLAEIAMLEHMESVLRSQAIGVAEMEQDGCRMRPGR